MTKFLLRRPIAIIMLFLASIIFSILAFLRLPVSLLPAIDVPQIVIKVNYPNGSPEEIEANILRPIRETLATLNHISEVNSEASSETGKIQLIFEYNAPMDLSYIEVNEKLDRLSNSLPEDLERPVVSRINISDIPIAHIQLVPKVEGNMLTVSKLVEKVIKKRLESLKGVSLVDLNGLRKPAIIITPNEEKLHALGLTVRSVLKTIQQHNLQLGSLRIKDGHYRYFLKVAREAPQDVASIRGMHVETPSGKSYTIDQLALVEKTETKTLAYHFFNNREGIVIAVHKQARAQMNQLIPLLYHHVNLLKNDFPEIEFKITRDQSELLNAGIDNLRTSLISGGLFAFAILFVFMRNFRIPLIIGISLPASILLSFLLFYLFRISLNIISLSGLALGLGMLIDNAIIVLDNITRKLENQRVNGVTSLFNACVEGVNEVITPLLSAVLTTLAIFIPLVFLNGLTGALFYDQAIAVAATLGASLLVAFILLPMCYLLFFRRSFKYGDSKKLLNFYQENMLYQFLALNYKKILTWVFHHKTTAIFLILLLLPLAIIAGYNLRLMGLPHIENTELRLVIDWNEPISVQENRNRANKLAEKYDSIYTICEIDIGNKQFISGDHENNTKKAEFYFKFNDKQSKQRTATALEAFLLSKYPMARFELLDPPNAFNMLFNTSNPYFEARFKNSAGNKTLPHEVLSSVLHQFKPDQFRKSKGISLETKVLIHINNEKLALLNVDYTEFIDKLRELFADNTVTEFRRFGEILPIKLDVGQQNFEYLLKTTFINSKKYNEQEDYGSFPLNTFISYEFIQDYKSIAADLSGVYHSVLCDKLDNYNEIIAALTRIATKDGRFTVSFMGDYFRNQENLQQLYFILLISLALLFFILAAQFESFLQPFIVILTLPLGIAGSLLFLWLFGNNLNIMSGIGIIVMLGIMVNDAIIKIDTMNRLAAQEQSLTKEILKKVIFRSGHIRLKPILMTSLTTILALVPVLFSSGLGADLQTPLILSVIGGLTVGTLTALFFIPLAYYYVRLIDVK